GRQVGTCAGGAGRGVGTRVTTAVGSAVGPGEGAGVDAGWRMGVAVGSGLGSGVAVAAPVSPGGGAVGFGDATAVRESAVDDDAAGPPFPGATRTPARQSPGITAP